MNNRTYWLLVALSLAVEVWGIAIGNRDITAVGFFLGLGVAVVARLLYRADQCEGGEEA
ncbi:hypothetical protein [Streptomyces aureus]|uniref:hypothetical protein n=1 Tax=Streptomyces aureus TaxID=193461 RepID=UPI000AD07F4B|nr:hypothetical protein [Streptomyces aureus]